MPKNNRSFNVVYPEEREGRTKDANRKLRSQVKSLRKAVKRLEEENRTLFRAFGKSCDFIQHKLSDKNLEQVLRMVENFNYKETKKGIDLANKKKESKKEESCPDCENSEGYKEMVFETFEIKYCSCGYRSKVEKDEGVQGS